MGVCELILWLRKGSSAGLLNSDVVWAKFVLHAGNMKFCTQNEVYMSLHVSLYLCICIHITSNRINTDDYRRNYYKMQLTTWARVFLFLAHFYKAITDVMYVSITKQLIKFSKLLQPSILALQGKGLKDNSSCQRSLKEM